MKKLTLLAALLIFLTGLVSSASVGAAPGFVDFGEVEPGDTVQQEVYVTTNFGQEFIVEPEFGYVRSSARFDESNDRRHETSDNYIGDWFEIPEEAEIDPNETETYELEDGSSVNADGVFTYEITVPSNAEPGYHYGAISLNPGFDTEGGAGTVNWGETRPFFRLRVPGQAERGIDVTDVNGIRIGEERVQLIMQLQNTGTVTTRMTGGNLSILDDEGYEIDEIDVPPATLAPGEVAEVDRTWSYEDLEGGNYEVDGIGDYRTGETHISGDFSVSSVIQQREAIDEPEAEQDEEESDIPLTLVLMLLMILGAVLYFFEIDFFWIVVFVGFVGISAFIFFSAASNLLILILVFLIGVTVYYGT